MNQPSPHAPDQYTRCAGAWGPSPANKSINADRQSSYIPASPAAPEPNLRPWATSIRPGPGSPVEPLHTIFADAPAPGFTDTVNFTTAGPVTIAGVNLFNFSDDNSPGGNRNTSAFRLLADTPASATNGQDDDGDGQVDEGGEYQLLVGTPGVPATGPGPADDGSANAYAFAPVTATSFIAEFTRGGESGLRIVELDAIVREPATLGLLAVGGLGLLGRRRR